MTEKAPADQMFGKGKSGKAVDSFAKGHKTGGSMHKKASAMKMSNRKAMKK